MSNKFVIVLLLFLISSLLKATDKTDSLIYVFNNNQNVLNKTQAANQLSKIFKNSDPDTSLYFANEALRLATKSKNKEEEGAAWSNIGKYFRTTYQFDTSLVCYNKALIICTKVHDTLELTRVLNSIANVHSIQGNNRKAIEVFQSSIVLKELIGDMKGAGINYYNVGNSFMTRGMHNEALQNYNKAESIFTEVEYDKGLAALFNSIGIIYDQWENSDMSIKYYQRALKIENASGNLSGSIDLYNNIGHIFNKQQLHDSTISYYSRAIKISREIEDKYNEAKSLINLGLMYCDKFDYEESNKLLKEALEISKDLNIPDIESSVYHALGYNYVYQGECDVGLEYIMQSLEIAEKAELREMISSNYIVLSQAYMCNKDGQKASKYFRKYVKDRENVNKELNDLRVQFETEKQEQEIVLLNKDKELQNERLKRQSEEMKRQQLMLIAFIAGFGIILIFSVIVLRQFRQKKKANILLADQRDEIQLQRDQIAHIHEEITDSINYAKRIQNAILPKEENVFAKLSDHFIFFRPKDIVSGDFYWAAEMNDWLILSAADCTGHGVPGAFMSMLGISFLNEIVGKKEIVDPALILNNLRASIIEALKQTGEQGTQKDGMDMSIIAISNDLLPAGRQDNPHTLTRSALWAGANNPLWIIRKENQNNPDVEDTATLIEEIKAEKMPVAVYDKMDEFVCHEVKVNEGDKLYLITDGYPDQFGGPKGKKFMHKRFKRLLVETSTGEMKDQRAILEKELDTWMNDHHEKHEQVDDITVIGVRI